MPRPTIEKREDTPAPLERREGAPSHNREERGYPPPLEGRDSAPSLYRDERVPRPSASVQ